MNGIPTGADDDSGDSGDSDDDNDGKQAARQPPSTLQQAVVAVGIIALCVLIAVVV